MLGISKCVLGMANSFLVSYYYLVVKMKSEDMTDEEIIQWAESFLSMEDRFSVIPDDYWGEYYKKFSEKEDIMLMTKQDFNGDIFKVAESHPALHAYLLHGFKLRPYQVFMLDMMLKYSQVFFVCGRRLGKSLVNKMFDIWALHWNKYPQGIDGTTKILVLAHTQGSADAYIAELMMYIETGDTRVFNLFKGKFGDKYFSSRLPTKGKKGKKVNQNHMDYLSTDGKWSRIITFPPTLKARGEAASIIQMDEVAAWDEYTSGDEGSYEVYYEVVRPVITDEPDTKIFGLTTPAGASGMSYELMNIDDHDTPFHLIWIPFFYRKDVQYLRGMRKTYEEYKNQGRVDEFKQEFLALLISKGKTYFHQDEIDNVFNNKYEFTDRYTGKVRFAIDFGGSKNSHTTITGVIAEMGFDKDGKEVLVIHRIYHKRYNVGQDSTIKPDILDIQQRFPFIEKWYVDSQGGGSAFYDWFRSHVGGQLDEVVFRKEKVDMYRLFKIGTYTGRVKSYKDKDLADEFHSFTGDLKPTKGHTDDLLDGFVMAAKDWLVEKKDFKFKAYTLNNRGASQGWSPSIKRRM